MLNFKLRHFEKEIILLNVRWYLAYPVSYRNLEEMAEERGYRIDHSTTNLWVIKYSPELEKTFQQKKQPVGLRWRMDETYIKVKGQWKYLYRAVDKEGTSIDYLLTAKRDMKAAKRFFTKAINRNGQPELVNIDKSGSNKAALNSGEFQGACRHLINDRFDINGARWGLQTAEGVLKLRAIKSSGDLDDYYQFYKKQELKRNYPEMKISA